MAEVPTKSQTQILSSMVVLATLLAILAFIMYLVAVDKVNVKGDLDVTLFVGAYLTLLGVGVQRFLFGNNA